MDGKTAEASGDIRYRDARLTGPVVATLLLHLVFTGLYLHKYEGDVSAFVCLGSLRASLPAFRHVTRVLGPGGHDGQFYYAFSQQPWHKHDAAEIDLPPLRHSRILYPALCWMLSGGNPKTLLYIMPAVNLLAIVTLAWIGAAYALSWGRSCWWGFLLPLAVNVGLSLLHDFTDCLAMLTAAGLLIAFLSGASAWQVAAWAVAAILSREQNLCLLGIVGLAAIGSRRIGVLFGLAGAVALWAGWEQYVWRLYGVSPVMHHSTEFSWPLRGMIFRLVHLGGNVTFSRRLALIQLLSMAHLIALTLVGIYLALSRRQCVASLVLLAGAVLAIFVSSYIYMDFWSYTRVFAWLPLGIWLTSVRCGLRWPVYVLAPGGLWSLVAALGYV